MAPPRWNHGAVAVDACPNGLLFVFGGMSGDLAEEQRAQPRYRHDLHVLDLAAFEGSRVRTTKWTEVRPVKATPPKKRADMGAVYNPVKQEILIFGGWANRWFNDVHSLDVKTVVGPPYAVTGVSPTSGPNLGNTKITVYDKDKMSKDDTMFAFWVRRAAAAAATQAPRVTRAGPGAWCALVLLLVTGV